MTERPLIDHTTVACLGDGWHAAMCVDRRGQTWPWLLTPDCTCGDHSNGCNAACCAPHEQGGRLPMPIRSRINRCQRTRGSWRCSRPVPLGQDRCWQHQEVTG